MNLRSTHPLTRKPAVLVTGTLLSALVLAGCGSSDTTTQPAQRGSTSGTISADAFNAQDVSYATDMLSHHRQAVDMAEMALDRPTTPQVKDLATRIKAEQSPEIATLTAFLTAFGKPVPAAGADDPAGHGMGGHMATGMMTADQMKGLGAATGGPFVKEFLMLMTEHHGGAVEMSRTELASGQYAPAKDLATAVVKAQTAEIAEIAEMKGLLAKP